MTANTSKPQDLDTSIKKLSISPSSKPSKSRPPISSTPDDWEEVASSSSSTTSTASSPSTPHETQPPNAPPPTPISPTSRHARNKSSTDWTTFNKPYPLSSSMSASRSPQADLDKRPEKSSAAAGRMIAGALGVRAPKKTEEGKAYEKAVRENERKRRERAKEEKEKEEREREANKRAIWEE